MHWPRQAFLKPVRVCCMCRCWFPIYSWGSHLLTATARRPPSWTARPVLVTCRCVGSMTQTSPTPPSLHVETQPLVRPLCGVAWIDLQVNCQLAPPASGSPAEWRRGGPCNTHVTLRSATAQLRQSGHRFRCSVRALPPHIVRNHWAGTMLQRGHPQCVTFIGAWMTHARCRCAASDTSENDRPRKRLPTQLASLAVSPTPAYVNGAPASTCRDTHAQPRSGPPIIPMRFCTCPLHQAGRTSTGYDRWPPCRMQKAAAEHRGFRAPPRRLRHALRPRVHRVCRGLPLWRVGSHLHRRRRHRPPRRRRRLPAARISPRYHG